MTRDEITQANALWALHKDTINAIAKLDLNSSNFVQARIWPLIDEIESKTKTDQVRLIFIDPCQHEFADRGYMDLKFGLEIKDGDAFTLPALPIMIELDVCTFQGLSISIQLQLPEENSKYRTKFLSALNTIKHQLKEAPDSWHTSLTLAEIELKPNTAPFDIDSLANQLPGTLQGLTRRVLEPLAHALQKGTKSP
ncbi:MAG: hypothetical protein N4A65_09315 [Cohaesibacter sp.]|jgi:hypothetical protein|nr:hypothetical protein [Cohaesibacter sp.]